MPFGLCNAPATFQRAMTLVLRGLTWEEVLAYLDDIILLGKSFEDCLKTIIAVFDTFRENDLKLKAKKCVLFQRKVIFLGKEVSNEGVSPNPSSVEKVLSWPSPKTVKEVERFLGLVNYHRAHIKNFAKLADPLYRLTHKGKGFPFTWEEEHKKSFKTLKEALVSTPVLGFPRNGEDLFILDTDASDTAIGAELLQVQDGAERLIGYGSYTLTPAQRNYCTTRKELLAVVRFTRQFRHYLLGRKFYIRTDHGSLAWLMRFKNISGMLARWLEELSQYDMVILHRKGSSHLNADARSRIPETVDFCDCYRAGCKPDTLPCGGCHFCVRVHNQWSRFEDEVDDVIPLSVRQVVCFHPRRCLLVRSQSYCQDDQGLRIRFIEVEEDDPDEAAVVETSPLSLATKYSSGYLRREQLKDAELGKLLRWKEGEETPLLDGERCSPRPDEIQLSTPGVKFLWSNKTILKVVNGVLYYRWIDDHSSRLLFLVPVSLRDEVLRLCHDLKMIGHPGIDRTYAKLCQSVFWYGMRQDCKIFVKSCPDCNRQKKSSRKARGSLGSYHAGAPVERVHIDILGPFSQSSAGNKYIIMLVCQFTKWIEAYPVTSCTSEEVAEKVITNFITRFGCPLQIHTDQGSNFTSALFRAICDLLDVTKTRTTPYRPCSNGQVERYNRTLLQIMRCYLNENVANWDKDLEILTGAIRSLPNRQSGFTPNMLMLGREVPQPVDLMFGVSEVNSESQTEPDYVHLLRERLRKAHTTAREKIRATQQYQQKYYDYSKCEHSYEVGDLVLKLNKASKTGEPSKLQPIWKGPFLVIEMLSPLLMRIRGKKKSMVVHHDLVKKCTDRYIPAWMQRLRNQYLNGATTDQEEEMVEDADFQADEDLGLAALFDADDRSVDQSSKGCEDVQKYTWVQCDVCDKWRRILKKDARAIPKEDPWQCSQNMDVRFSSCQVPEEDFTDWLQGLDRKGLTFTVKDSVKSPQDDSSADSSSGQSAGVPTMVTGRTRSGRKTTPPARFQD